MRPGFGFAVIDARLVHLCDIRSAQADHMTSIKALEYFDKLILGAGWIFAPGEQAASNDHKIGCDGHSWRGAGNDEANGARARCRPAVPPSQVHWLTASRFDTHSSPPRHQPRRSEVERITLAEGPNIRKGGMLGADTWVVDESGYADRPSEVR